MQRSGSTLLTKLLNLHSEIYTLEPIKPEPKYFLSENYKGKEIYLKFFSELPHHYQYFLEKSVAYIEHEDAMKKIYKDFPSAKILIILREPIDRAFSNYKFSFNSGVENRNFKDSIKDQQQPKMESYFSMSPFDYIERGFYKKFLTRAYNVFPNENIKIVFLEELINSTNNLNQIFRWLNLQIIDIEENFYRTKVNNINSDPLDLEIINYLSLIYKDSILDLEELLGRKIDCWRDIWKKRGITI